MTLCAPKWGAATEPRKEVLLKGPQERICFGARQRDTECARRAEFFGLKRVVSCGSGAQGWRTKLDVGGGEPLDDLHGSSTVGTTIKIRSVLGGGSVLFHLWLWCRA
jgi:hypothetical protein